MYICSYGSKRVGVLIFFSPPLLEKSHSVVNVTIFMSAVEYT